MEFFRLDSLISWPMTSRACSSVNSFSGILWWAEAILLFGGRKSSQSLLNSGRKAITHVVRWGGLDSRMMRRSSWKIFSLPRNCSNWSSTITCDCLPSASKGLLRAIQETWPEGTAKPATLTDMINPLDALGRQSHVIVLDQFEQLRGNEKIFKLLRRIIRESKPPHRTTWVIAFRPEFSNDWLDFISLEQENGLRPPKDVSLKLFTAEQAREVIGQLINESDLKDSIEQSVIDNLVEAATVDGVVSPVDIGIGLLVLTELHERQSGQTITKRDYQFAGGAEGLLTQYISRCLEPFPKESQETILKAMLALRDPEENRQRLATGLTIDELAVEAGTDVRVLKSATESLGGSRHPSARSRHANRWFGGALSIAPRTSDTGALPADGQTAGRSGPSETEIPKRLPGLADQRQTFALPAEREGTSSGPTLRNTNPLGS